MLAFLFPGVMQAFAIDCSFQTTRSKFYHGRTICTSSKPLTLRRRVARPCPTALASSGAHGPVEPPIKIMACDVDGTLLKTTKDISSTNVSSIMRVLEETDTIFVLATGKSRAGALKSLGPKLGNRMKQLYPAGCPGVFLQGLVVFNLQGEIIYEATLSTDLASKAVNIMRELDIDLIAYSRDTILCEKETAFTRMLPEYHEPMPISIGSWGKVIEGNVPLNKLIYMAEPDHIDEIRPLVEAQIGDIATLTQAQSNMLEVLPPNTNKGNGVRQLLSHLNINPSNCLAIGDAENDIELLRMVGYSCAVQNALPSVKTVAKFTLEESNDEDGVSSAILRFLLPASNPAHI